MTHLPDFRHVDAARRRVAGTLTVAMMVIYSIPLSFLVAIVVALTWPEPEAASGFAEVERRVHVGVAEGAVDTHTGR